MVLRKVRRNHTVSLTIRTLFTMRYICTYTRQHITVQFVHCTTTVLTFVTKSSQKLPIRYPLNENNKFRLKVLDSE